MNTNKQDIYINPFLGMVTIKLLIPILLVLLVVAFKTSGLLSILGWALSFLVAFFSFGQLYGRLSTPWRRVHFPLMVVFSSFSGSRIAYSQKTGENYSVNEPLKAMASALLKNWSETEVNDLLSNANDKFTAFSDKDRVLSYALERNSEADRDELKKTIDNFDATMKVPQNEKYLRVRWFIAEIIELKYGIGERYAYLFSVLTGDAL